MKQIQISEELFIQLVRFHLCDDDLWQEEIEQGLQSKLDAIVNRNLYTQYKSADTGAEREKARIAYLDSVGMQGLAIVTYSLISKIQVRGTHL